MCTVPVGVLIKYRLHHFCTNSVLPRPHKHAYSISHKHALLYTNALWVQSTEYFCLVKIQGLRQEIRHNSVQSYSTLTHATVGPNTGRRSRRCCIPDRRDHHFSVTFLPDPPSPTILSLLQPPPHTQFKMASAVRFGSSAFRSSLAAPAFNARIAAFNGARCYSAKTQVKQFLNNSMRSIR